MLFNSWEFAGFWVVVFALYTTLSHRGQNWLLLVASYLFYASWDWRFVFLLTGSALIDYAVGLAIVRTPDQRRKRRLVAASITANLVILGFFKYFGFFADSLHRLLALIGLPVALPVLHLLLPVGISFYTFQSMSYGIDVYRGELTPTRSLRDYLLFVSFFPHLIAGPIMRATNLLPQITGRRHVSFTDLREGPFLFCWGLFLKVFVADNLARLADPVFLLPGPFTGMTVLVGVYAFAFQIYGDFAGYSTMARGLGRCLGFDLSINFNLPYISRGPSEFWRRWHIMLSTWLRDYLYIPLGGSRRGTWFTVRNLAITMLLGGLWHGAAWTFVAWGAYHAVLLAIYRMPALASRPEPRQFSARWWLEVVIFFHLVCLGWLLFRAPSIGRAGALLSAVLVNFHPAWTPTCSLLLKILVPLLVIEALQLVDRDLLAPLRLRPSLKAALYVCGFYLLVVYGAYASKEFIYFQF